FDMKNSNFDRFYQQSELKHGDHTIKSVKHGVVEVLDADGKLVQKIEQLENKDQHHLAPLMLWEKWLLVGTDDGRVLFYTMR
ncbi:MAG TPA: hypothetical protein PK760_02905, partial [Flavobacteriales bacterium]|nr:hypothetical protein [Flavobacteriales bacterium]